MTLILLDGLEDLSSWSSSNMTIVAGRNGNGVKVTGTTGSGDFTVPAALESDTMTVGFAVKFGGATGTNYDLLILRSDASATAHVSLRWSTDGSLSAGRSSGAGLISLGTSVVGLITSGVWYYIELQTKMHDTTGFVTVRVNGVTVISVTNVDTKNAGTKTTFDTVRLMNSNPSTALPIFDDLYLMAGTGDAFLGDIKIETLYPNGDGNANAWLGSDGDSTNNYLLVDEAGTPDTTDYVASSTSGQQDLYALTDLVSTTGTVVGVCHAAYVAKTDAGVRRVKLVDRRAADTKSVAIDVPAAYTSLHYVLTSDPDIAIAEESISTANTPNDVGSNFNPAVRVQFSVAGLVTKIRYRRLSGCSNDLKLQVWDDTSQLKIAELNEDLAGASQTGQFTVTFGTPVAVAAGDIRIFSITGVGPPRNLAAQTVTNSAHMSYLGARYGALVGSFPSFASSEAYYVEPIMVAAPTLPPWTIANVNALQSGVEVV